MKIILGMLLVIDHWSITRLILTGLLPAWQLNDTHRYKPPKGKSHIKRLGALVVPFRGEKSGFGTPLRVLSLKRSTVGIFAVPLRILSEQK